MASMGRNTAMEHALRQALDASMSPATPPRLRAALHHAAFPAGGRLRPRLLLRTAAACGDPSSRGAVAAAVAVEFLHCASLVHDDLPCFDDAALRRGRPSVHAKFGQALAVLTGDALIVAAFETLGRGCADDATRLGPLLASLSAGVGAARGLVAGQAWECEACVDLRQVHRAKTGALFETCVVAGAIAGGGEPDAWRPLGRRLGEAYQVADDIADFIGTPQTLGKPVGQDALLGRPSAALELGLSGAYARLEGLIGELGTEVPDCSGADAFRSWIEATCLKLLIARDAPEGSAEHVSRSLSA
jgi:geranylgeranyl diphosphate synthase, type II